MHSPMEEEQCYPLKTTFSETHLHPSQIMVSINDDHAKNHHPSSSLNPDHSSPRGRNIIAVLDTSGGKTMIAVMLIKDFVQPINSIDKKKLIIFLAPTVHLVNQQFEYIKFHTSLDVEQYYGDKGVNEWNSGYWEKDIKEHDVLVMTPQILLDALWKAFRDGEFYHKSNNKPKIFGMTASPVVSKGALSNNDCEDQISELENVMDCMIYAIEDMTEMETYVPTAKESCRFFDPTRFCSSGLKAMIEASWLKIDASLSTLQGSIQTSYTDMDDKFKALHKRSSNDHAKILHCLDDLGLICAYEAVKVCLENIPDTKEECEAYKEGVLQCKRFLNEVLQIIGESLPLGDENFLNSGFDYLKAVDSGYISPKLHELIEFFLSLGEPSQVLCLVFVERIVTAKVIERFVKKVNLFFATDVVEEGIHIPNCSCVIRFDLPKTVLSYVQSRGRARQSGSQFIMMLERGNEKQRDQLYDLIRSEHSMTSTAMNRDPDLSLPENRTLEETNVSIMAATGASIEETSKNRCASKGKDPIFDSGTTRWKELHGTTQIRAFSGSWGEKADASVFFAYKIDFSCNVVSVVYSGFVLLIESKLADDVGNIEVDLYLIGKIAKARVSFYGKVHLDAVQITAAKRFQEIFFNGLFGRLFVGSSRTSRELLFHSKTSLLWHPFNINELRINWPGITACTLAVEFLTADGNRGNPSLNQTDSSVTEHKETNVIHFANRSIDVNNISNIVVLAIHTGRIYSTIELVHDTSAKSSFNDIVDMNSSKFATFSEYCNRKYCIVLKHPGQPLLLLKQSHNPHNLLVDFNDEDFSAQALQASSVNEKSWNNIHMPPKLLLVLDVPVYVLKAFYLLPSLMHRLESLMLASQLREEIDFRSSNFGIPSSMILEALTTLRCCESFSMERLEFLGDSVLKYAVSYHLFLRDPEKHEGELSMIRSLALRNSTLHKLGTDCKLQGYIRDSAFDPRRWVAPGQLRLRSFPCNCRVDSREVPLDKKFQTEDLEIKVSISCDRGHRWMCSKTISDCVEALIGAYYVSGGLIAALHMMKWLGIDAELDPSLVAEAINRASLQSYVPNDEIQIIESKIGYKFSMKFFLQEALTHASANEFYCYQRLEFLGDSVLDLLITRYLYCNHTDIDSGELTDLRSASVSNETFAQVAVRNDLHKHLRHCSTLLLDQISEYAQSFPESWDTTRSVPGIKGPKALGDLIESIVAAILIDTNLNLDEVWRIVESLLSPIVTPDKLEEKCVNTGEMVHAKLWLQLDDILLVGEAFNRSKKVAKGKAALYLLKELEDRGISRKRTKQDHAGSSGTTDDDLLEPKMCKKQRIAEIPSPTNDSSRTAYGTEIPSPANASSRTAYVIARINTNKGRPRATLYEICQKQLWPRPTFETTEGRSRSPMEIGKGADRKIGFNSFVTKITLNVPSSGIIECSGDVRADKKSSCDSAAILMLYRLKELGKLIIRES
ncbi:hypothetical protein ES319_D13G222800v1 [Gossypium barbadense]|uniref:Uncharacterized protein n=1 Tax=Gossypium barbadense TaxID=3634 RepID=A0A5J5NQ07_GOSBA|nr:hypothetical protein ES319_D13G222800v1 [Gossypium barbadense]